MMSIVVMEHWREGIEKVSLTKLQVELLRMPLKEAKNNVDSLLDNEKVLLKIGDIDTAQAFLERAKKLGVSCRIEL